MEFHPSRINWTEFQELHPAAYHYLLAQQLARELAQLEREELYRPQLMNEWQKKRLAELRESRAREAAITAARLNQTTTTQEGTENHEI